MGSVPLWDRNLEAESIAFCVCPKISRQCNELSGEPVMAWSVPCDCVIEMESDRDRSNRVQKNVGEFRGRREASAKDGSGATSQVSPEFANVPVVEPGELGEILHGLNNVLVSIVLNAEIMEWKLPSYSRMRRNTHEIQRSAQRAGVLLKRLTVRTDPPEASADVKAS